MAGFFVGLAEVLIGKVVLEGVKGDSLGSSGGCGGRRKREGGGRGERGKSVCGGGGGGGGFEEEGGGWRRRRGGEAFEGRGMMVVGKGSKRVSGSHGLV